MPRNGDDLMVENEHKEDHTLEEEEKKAIQRRQEIEELLKSLLKQHHGCVRSKSIMKRIDLDFCGGYLGSFYIYFLVFFLDYIDFDSFL
jgi:hypothetical protein